MTRDKSNQQTNSDNLGSRRFEDHAIGMLPNGTLNIVNADDPPFEPQIVDELGRPVVRTDRQKNVRPSDS